MSVGEHNPARRALLGAAVALSFDTGLRQAQPLLRMSGEADAWRWALAALHRAEAEAREAEGWPEREEEYGDRLDALYIALRRLLRLPAPDLGAFALKVVLAIDHEVGTLSGGEACLAAIRREALRLARSG